MRKILQTRRFFRRFFARASVLFSLRQAALLTIVRRQVVGHRRAVLPTAVRRRAAVRHRVDFHLLPPVVEEEASLAEADVAAGADDSCATDLYVVKN